MDGLSYLGIEIDPVRNAKGEQTISSYASRVLVHVIPTDEAFTIARDMSQLMQGEPIESKESKYE